MALAICIAYHIGLGCILLCSGKMCFNSQTLNYITESITIKFKIQTWTLYRINDKPMICLAKMLDQTLNMDVKSIRN